MDSIECNPESPIRVNVSLMEERMVKEATMDDARAIAQKLNLNKDLVWNIIAGKKYNSPSELAMAIQQAFSMPAPVHQV